MSKINFILNNLPNRVYKTDEESNLYKFLSSFGEELDSITLSMEELKRVKFVDTSSGEDLNKLGGFLNIRKYANESDDAFRARVKTRVETFIGGGTVEALKTIIQKSLGVEPTIIEHWKSGQGHLIFDNGVLNGFNLEALSGLNAKINNGVAYYQGTKFDISNTPKEINVQTLETFINKIAGSTVENGHLFKRNSSQTALQTPTGAWSEVGDTNYTSIKVLDNNSRIDSSTVNLVMVQHMFSFDVIWALTNKYGNQVWQGQTSLANKVAIAKTLITKLVCNWYGYGSDPSGNKINLTKWNVSSSGWEAVNAMHTSGAVTKISTSNHVSYADYIDANGFIHILAYANASNGTINSRIVSDYVELELEADINTVNNFTLEPNKTLNALITKEGLPVIVTRNNNANEIKLATIVTDATTITSIIDDRVILNPFEDSITNTATITMQIPYDFVEGYISLENVKDILRSTKAAGNALLIKLIETMNDNISFNETVNTTFEVGFSALGGLNFIGERGTIL